MANNEMKEFRAESRAFAAKHLKECAAEIIEWQDTAVLRDGRVRELAALCGKFIDNHDQLRVAESLINRAAIDAVAPAPAQAEPSDALPDPHWAKTQSYTADQLRAYAKQAIEATRCGVLSDAALEEARREGWAQGMQEAQELLASEISDAALLDWLDGEEFVALNCYVAVYDEHGQPLEKERKHYLIERESSIATVEAPTVREAIRAAIQAQAGEGEKA